MMKKMMALVLAGMFVFSCACASKDGENVKNEKPTIQIIETTSAVGENVTSSAVNNGITEDEIRSLMKENLNCMYNIFCLGMLPAQGEAVENNVYLVDPSYFKDYASFESYVRSIYCEKTADMYLNNYPYEGVKKYENRDGMLYENRDYDGGKGYYVDWSEYTVTIDSVSDTECTFTMVASVEWPAEHPVKEPYEVKGKAVYENGKWLFTEMFSQELQNLNKSYEKDKTQKSVFCPFLSSSV